MLRFNAAKVKQMQRIFLARANCAFSTSTKFTTSLQEQAKSIQTSIDVANSNIRKNISAGLTLSQHISKKVPEDKFLRMQRYEIFIKKMEQLARFEQKQAHLERKAETLMQYAFVNGRSPLKEILYYYNKASTKGFNASLVSTTLKIVNQVVKARGNKPRVFDDYSTKELDQSWRMQQLIGHLKLALSDEMYFNHYFLAQTARTIGDIGYKDTELIQQYFNKLNSMLDERENKFDHRLKESNLEKQIYGNFQNFVPRHYVFQGFESSSEFQQYLQTLLDWQVETNDGLANLGVQCTEGIIDLENSLARLIEATNQITDAQVNFQASIDSMRQQYFKLINASDKHAFLQENKYIFFDLLELQELMVKAGYLNPEEVSQTQAVTHEARMERAAEIFYDYVQNYAPELMSQQHEMFQNAAQDSRMARMPEKQVINLDEEHDKISLSSLSQVLIGLHQQALSFRKEINGKDYLNKFYEDHVTQIDIKNTDHPDYNIYDKLSSPNVQMSREYLKAYSIFEKEIEKLLPRLEKLVNESSADLEGNLHALDALSACKVENQALRAKIFANLQNLLPNQNLQRVTPIIDALHGIAMQNEQTVDSNSVFVELLNKLDNQALTSTMTFDQKLDLLWSSCALGQEAHKVVASTFEQINHLNFERTDNDLTYNQQEKVRDVLIYMQRVSKIQKPVASNYYLNLIASNPSLHSQRYDESGSFFDPFKKRVLEGVTQGLSMASIDHKETLQANLFHQGKSDLDFQEQNYPYLPDLIFGYKGNKVLLNVIPASQTMRDVLKPDGAVVFQQKILRAINLTQNVKTMAVPITSVISYDIENLRLQMKESYDFVADLKSQLDRHSGGSQGSFVIDFSPLSSFGSQFTKDAPHFIAALKTPGDQRRIQSLFQQLYKIFQIKQQTERQYENPIKKQGVNALKFELMKLSLQYEQLPYHLKEYVNRFAKLQRFDNFKQLVHQCKTNISMNAQESPSADESKLDTNWHSTRLEVELPITSRWKHQKNIVPELINQRFMWLDDYFHYGDWELKMKNTYDSFNLLVIPRPQNSYKYFFDRNTHMRIVPQGIFPPPNDKRQILSSNMVNNSKHYQVETSNGADLINHFEKDPYRNMVAKELERSAKLDRVDDEMSFMTNLQNIKHGLKKDYSDKEIAEMLLNHLSFSETLIKNHLQGSQDNKRDSSSSVSFLPRNASKYREFAMNVQQSKDQEDAFSHFYILESAKQERVHKLYSDFEYKYADQIKNSETEEIKKHYENLKKTLGDKMDEMLLENQRENEDIVSLSHHLESEVQIKYNLQTLIKSENVYDVDPDLVNADLTDEAFLAKQRIRAETKLIKTKLIYKIDQGHPLTQNEQLYLQKWLQSLEKADILNHRDCMMPAYHSVDNLNSLDAKDFFTLNNICNVQLDRQKHKKFALNDLVLELSHFVDSETVDKVEMQLMSKRIKNEWGLEDNFKIIETRNKEINLVLKEMEEIAWRYSAALDNEDMSSMHDMLSIGRNKDYFDKQFYENDMQSLIEFASKANDFDNRRELIEEWIVRKEQEIKSRVVMPPAQMRKTDQTLFEKYDSSLKKARESLVAQMLLTDEFGNKVENKTYSGLTTPELSTLAESICVRLHLFGGNYPAFMPQAVKAVMEHPNLSKVDYDKLNAFSRMFELDWRGDRSVANKSEFLATNPVYLGKRDHSNLQGYSDLGNFETISLLRHACVPFVETLSAKMEQAAASKPE